MATEGVKAPRGDLSNLPIKTTAKGAAASPVLSAEDHVEMKDIVAGAPAPEEDIMQLARLGDVEAVRKLYDSGVFDALYCDGEGITPLHVSMRLGFWRTWLIVYSGRRSTINMPCANSSSIPVLMSTRRVESL